MLTLRLARTLALPGLIAGLALGACQPILSGPPTEVPDGTVTGARPRYVTDEEAARVEWVAPAPVVVIEGFRVAPGVFVGLDTMRGVGLAAVPDTLDGAFRLPTAFLRVLGSTQLDSLGPGLVRVSNFRDGVLLRIITPDSVLVVGREVDRFPEPAVFVRTREYIDLVNDPAFDGAFDRLFFECYDPARGAFAGWEVAPLTNPQCLAKP